MSKYVFTRRGFEEFKEYYRRVEQTLNRVTKEKSRAGSGQDAWHDEGFKLGIGEEMMWSKRFGELQDIMRNAEIVDSVEQNEIVRIGNGVIIEYEDGSRRKLILDGYLIEVKNHRASILSPLGRGLIGTKEGSEIKIRIAGKDTLITVLKILYPSEAEEKIAKNNDKKESKNV